MAKFASFFLIFFFCLDAVAIPENSKLMIAALEYGTLDLGADGSLQAKEGEASTIVGDMLSEFPGYWQKKTNDEGELFFALMAYDGAVIGSEIASLAIQMGAKQEKVKVTALRRDKDDTLLLFYHPAFTRTKTKTKYTARPEWEDAYKYALFAQSVAEISNRLDITLFHGIDLAALAVYFMDPAIVATASLISYEKNSLGIFSSGGDALAMKNLCGLIGIPQEDFNKYFSKSGDLVLMRVLHFIAEQNLYAAVLPSAWAAKDFPFRPKIATDSSQMAAIGRDAYREYFSQNFDPTVWSSVDSGLSLTHHPSKNPYFLKDLKMPESAVNSLPTDVQASLKQIWEKVGPYPIDDEDPVIEVNFQKSMLKRVGQQLFGVAPGVRPWFLFLGPINGSRNLDMIEDAAKLICELGADLILADLGAAFESSNPKLAAKLKSYFVPATNEAGTVKIMSGGLDEFSRSVLLGASDFVLVPSKYEITPLKGQEAVYYGSIPIGRSFGDIDSNTNQFSYNYLLGVPSGESILFQSKIVDALTVFRTDPKLMDKIRLQRINPEYLVTDAFDWYVRIYDVIDLYRKVKDVDERRLDDVSSDEVRAKMLRAAEPKVASELKNALKKKIAANPSATRRWEKDLAVKR